MSTIIGIDLGTSTTEAAVYRDGRPEMIPGFGEKIILPSAVGIDTEGNWITGEKARAQLLLYPENTAIEIKRKIGSGEKIKLGGQNYTAVQLSAKLLEAVKRYASDFLGEEIGHAVISVPAYFNEHQRRETAQAGREAGLQVERILNEPTAAALSYGLDHMEEESHILVYDLGGGTFDVTLLEMFDGVLEVKASSGDNTLGGKDFDELLIRRLLKDFRRKTGVSLEKDKFAMVKLKEAAENCKIALSTQPSCDIRIPMITSVNGKPLSLDETVTAAQLKEMSRELMARTHHPIDVVLKDAGIRPEQLDRIILVGGSTRMPFVAGDIREYLGMDPVRAVDPDFAVAGGAAIQAALISGEIRPEEGLIMTDVNPYTLGIRCHDGFTDNRMSVVIPRNKTIPVSRSEKYCTFADGQTRAEIEVFQGESEIASSNHFLGKFMLGGIPPRPAGMESIDVRFSYNLNGMLDVKATICSTGKDASIRIDMMNREEKPRSSDPEGWKSMPEAKKYRALIRRVSRRLENKEPGTGLNAALEVLLEELKAAVADGDEAKARELADAISAML